MHGAAASLTYVPRTARLHEACSVANAAATDRLCNWSHGASSTSAPAAAASSDADRFGGNHLVSVSPVESARRVSTAPELPWGCCSPIARSSRSGVCSFGYVEAV